MKNKNILHFTRLIRTPTVMQIIDVLDGQSEGLIIKEIMIELRRKYENRVFHNNLGRIIREMKKYKLVKTNRVANMTICWLNKERTDYLLGIVDDYESKIFKA